MSIQSSSSKYFIRNPGAAAPTLGLAQSFWALTQREISIGQSLEAAMGEGVEYFEVGLREDRLDETRQLMRTFPMKLIAQGWATSASEAIVFLERATEFRAVALNLHLGHAYLSTSESVDMVGEVQQQADAYGIPLLFETHRGRMTQDLFRTSEILKQCPEMVLALDVSHYLVAGETLGGSEPLFHSHLAPLLSRTALIHGRISNGQSVQVETKDRFAFTAITQSIWQEAMKHWLQNAPADAVFLFEPELGPPPYAYVNLDGSETYSRTTDSRRLTELAREAWTLARLETVVAEGVQI